MATQTIQYQNKVALNTNPEIADINKVTDNDMNEIKTVVNNNAGETSNNTTGLTNLKTYSTSEVNTGKIWIDGKPIYRKYVSNLSNGDTIVSNVSDIVFNYIIINYNSATNYYNHTNTEVTLNKSTHRAIINGYNTMQNSTFAVIIEYTKTTN